MTRKFWRRAVNWLACAGVRGVACALGFILMILGLAMGVSLVLLPIGLAVGLFGVVVVVWAIFGDVPGSARV